METMPRASVTVARPQPTTLQKGGTDSGSALPASSGSSGSFVVLPPGARLPDLQPRLDLPPLSLMNPPPKRRLSRYKPLPPTPNLTDVPQHTPPPPSSWAVPFRGFVKAVRWSRSDPHLKTNLSSPENSNKMSPTTYFSKETPETPHQDGGQVKIPLRTRITSFSRRKRTQSGAGGSKSTGGVFLVPHVQPVQPELRPPTSGWMHPVSINPLEFSSPRTAIGHSNPHSRVSLDGLLHTHTFTSPPLADLPQRKSVSEIGHGSVMYASLSPQASSSTIEHFHQFPTASPAQSRELFPRSNFEFVDPEPEPQPMVPPKSRLQGLRRALSFKRMIKHQSASDIPNAPSLYRHQTSKSFDIDRPVMEMAALDKERPNRLRRQSVLGKQRDESPSPFLFRDPPKFMLSPEASESSILSTNVPFPLPVTPQPSTSSGRRLVKRKPSENKKSSLPSTLEVDTPKSLVVPNPMEALVIPPYPPLPHQMVHAPASLPHSAPVLATMKPLPISPNVSPLTMASPTPSDSSSIPMPTSSPSFPRTPTGAPPSAMRELRPAMPHRPSLERRASRRRWTLNIAAEDIDDDILTAELERLKSLGDPENSPDAGWTLAKKALLSSREVILTERTYLNQLTRFLEDVTPDSGTPPLLLKHIPILLSASQAFCNRMQEDPSAWGVSAAFVTVEAVLEQVLVDYCQVVGSIMLACQQISEQKSLSSSSSFLRHSLSKSKASIVNGAAGEFGKRIASKSSEKIGEEGEKGQGVGVSPGKSKVPRSRSMPSKDNKRKSMSAVDNVPASSLSMTPGDRSIASTPGGSPTHQRGASLAGGRARAATAADIAIAPPQRVTRYVMLFRDLLNGTPLTAPSRPLVQRALDSALRIAENCDKAQGDLSLFVKRRP